MFIRPCHYLFIIISYCIVCYKKVPLYIDPQIKPGGDTLVYRVDGVMRTMNTEKLLKTIPIIQNQMDALLDFNVSLDKSLPGFSPFSPVLMCVCDHLKRFCSRSTPTSSPMGSSMQPSCFCSKIQSGSSQLIMRA